MSATHRGGRGGKGKPYDSDTKAVGNVLQAVPNMRVLLATVHNKNHVSCTSAIRRKGMELKLYLFLFI